MTNEGEYLLRLARRGSQGAGASGGEARAFRIIDRLRRDLYGFDAEALRGLSEIVDSLYYEPMRTRDEIAEFIGEEVEPASE